MPEADQSKKVALFLPSMAGGGAERVVLAEARELVRRGHRVDLILSLGGGELLPLLPSEVRVIDVGASRMIGALAPLIRYLRREQPDALHATMWPSTVIAIIAHRMALSKARLIVSDHTILSRHVSNTRALRLTTRFLYTLADVRTQCSAAAAADLSELAQIPLNSIETINSPIEAPPAISTNASVEQAWGIAQGARILSVGSLNRDKNHQLLLKAFAHLDVPDRRLVIAGEGPERPRIEATARELRIFDRLILPGFVRDPWPYFASADLFVLSSDFEGFGLVLVEAMAAGLRVVSTDCAGGPAELLDGGRFGRIVPCGDAAALAEAMALSLRAPHDPEPGRLHAARIAGDAQLARLADLVTD